MTAIDIEIRPYRPADAEAFRRLNEEWIVEHFTLEEPDREVLNHPDRHILTPGGRILMAFRGEEAAGCCALIPTGHPGVLELAKMAVSPALRGQGIGRRILEHAIHEAKAMGATVLELGSNSVLANAIHLYESCGFQHRKPGTFPPSPYARANVFMEMRLD